jgi:hypothetical protein
MSILFQRQLTWSTITCSGNRNLQGLTSSSPADCFREKYEVVALAWFRPPHGIVNAAAGVQCDSLDTRDFTNRVTGLKTHAIGVVM